MEVDIIKNRYEEATGEKAIIGNSYSIKFITALCKKIIALEKKIVEHETEKINPALQFGELKQILTDEKEIEISLQ